MDVSWFNASSPLWYVRRMRTCIGLWNLFNRRSVEGHWWGFGLLQAWRRHLLFVGSNGICIGFVWIWRREGE